MKQPQGTRTAPVRTANPASMVQRVGDLAWAGQHAQAIELATTALAATRLSVAGRLDLLDLRAESFIAQGDLDHAGRRRRRDGRPRQDHQDSGTKAQALNRHAVVQTRKGEFKAAIGTAPPR